MSVPSGLSADDGLPVGLQIMAPALADDRLYRVGAACRRPPAADRLSRPRVTDESGPRAQARGPLSDPGVIGQGPKLAAAESHTTQLSSSLAKYSVDVRPSDGNVSVALALSPEILVADTSNFSGSAALLSPSPEVGAVSPPMRWASALHISSVIFAVSCDATASENSELTRLMASSSLSPRFRNQSTPAMMASRTTTPSAISAILRPFLRLAGSGSNGSVR